MITTNNLTVKLYGGVEMYMDKFENDLQDLEDLETPCYPIMAKLNILNNIEDEANKITTEILSMDNNKTYAQ